MLQAWLSIGFIILFAILLLAFVPWRRDNHVLAVAALVVGVPLIAIGTAGFWPFWSLRTIGFYGLSSVLWLAYFYAFFWLNRACAPDA